MSTSDCWLHRRLVRYHCRVVPRDRLSRSLEIFENKKLDTSDFGLRGSEERYPA
jgi:hypothetical protein